MAPVEWQELSYTHVVTVVSQGAPNEALSGGKSHKIEKVGYTISSALEWSCQHFRFSSFLSKK